jgi:multiple sugar transport system ATP-binding protein
MTATVCLHRVGKQFAGKSVVTDVNMQIGAGEFVVLVGPSGCGKSTTLRMVAGLETISSGEVLIDNRVINTLAPKERGVAMVFQNYALYPHLSVFENIAFGLRLAGQKQAKVDEAVARAATILGLETLLARKPAELSGGQRQRVAMGRAIVREPRVFLFDEPLSNLDAKLRNTMRAEIKRLHQRLGSTVMYVTHDQVEAMTLADRIVVMRDGRVEQIGTPAELYDRPVNAFVAGFMGSPPMNLLPGQVAASDTRRVELADGQALAHLGVAASRLSAGQHVLIGLRPESITLGEGEGEGDGKAPHHIKLKAQVELVEALGAETVLHTRVAGHELLVRVPGRVATTQGHVLSLAVPLDTLHLFDATSGLALT